MSHRRWLLPEAIEDLLPAEACRLEVLRRRLLDAFAAHGYELVVPPLLEYVESLLTGSGRDLDLRTFKLVDQLSGRSMGLRADITPQVARIDAHLLNRQGVVRLCYCGSVLHTLPSGFHATREPIQLGAELYGHAGLEADIEVLRLLAMALATAGLTTSRVDLCHVGIFRALMATANPGSEREQEIFAALQGKDLPTLRELLDDVAAPVRDGLLALPGLYGDRQVLGEALRRLPPLPAIREAISDLERLADACSDLPLSFDLSDLRGYHYHSGVMFAAYAAGSAAAIVLGGRYDEIGKAYGRARPATGFSLDMKELLRAMPVAGEPAGAILAPWPEDDSIHAEAERLRALGERVMLALPGHEGSWREAGCDRRLVRAGNEWKIEPLNDT